ncbi:PREDICTED: uncharacterized protein LOC109192844 [Ipomoea nil]|uniref:uncharacterized protein LOC109192844 n=1 Tax=Ipomoea nil TaxID=35883 RepID=UPI000900CE7D|nr:PREDICTED: uncharacterized protein LOC109192844 [Ipomoea nil]
MAATTDIIYLSATSNFPITLTSTNFPAWRRQVHSTLVGFNLHGYVDGSVQEPPKFAGSAQTATNPDYLLWVRQDQIIVSALLGSSSDSIQPLVSSASTAYDAWQHLTTTYASASRGRILSLKAKLTQNPRGTRSITVFLNDMRSIADALALAQSPVSDEDLVVYILTQLGDEYNSIISTIRVRQKPICLAELADVLIGHEVDNRARQTVLATANVTHRNTQRSTSGRRFQYTFISLHSELLQFPNSCYVMDSIESSLLDLFKRKLNRCRRLRLQTGIHGAPRPVRIRSTLLAGVETPVPRSP